MRDPERIGKILGKLSGFWHKHPDLRFCQLVDIIADRHLEEPHNKVTLFYLEDDKLEECLDKWIETDRLSS